MSLVPPVIQSPLSFCDLHGPTARSFVVVWIREGDENLNSTVMRLLTLLQYLEISITRKRENNFLTLPFLCGFH